MFKSIKQFFDTLVSTMLQMNKVTTQRMEDIQAHTKKQDEILCELADKVARIDNALHDAFTYSNSFITWCKFEMSREKDWKKIYEDFCTWELIIEKQKGFRTIYMLAGESFEKHYTVKTMKDVGWKMTDARAIVEKNWHIYII